MKGRSRSIALAVLTLLGGLSEFCATHTPSSPIIPSFFVVVEAQTLPITKNFCWDDPDGTADTYIVTLDGTTQTGAVTPSGTITFCIPLTLTSAGAHIATVGATNLWGSAASASLDFTVKLPTAAGNLRFQ